MTQLQHEQLCHLIDELKETKDNKNVPAYGFRLGLKVGELINLVNEILVEEKK